MRYKGQVTARHIDRSHPCQVEISIPPTGLGKRLDAMFELCRSRGLDVRTRPARRRAEDAMRFCFAAAADADAFQRAFGGVRIDAGGAASEFTRRE